MQVAFVLRVLCLIYSRVILSDHRCLLCPWCSLFSIAMVALALIYIIHTVSFGTLEEPADIRPNSRHASVIRRCSVVRIAHRFVHALAKMDSLSMKYFVVMARLHFILETSPERFLFVWEIAEGLKHHGYPFCLTSLINVSLSIFTMLAQVIIYNCNLPPQCNLRFCFLLDGVLEYGQLPIWVMQMILISHDLRNLMRFALHVILSIYLILPNQLLDMSRPFTTKVSLIIPLIH